MVKMRLRRVFLILPRKFGEFLILKNRKGAKTERKEKKEKTG